MNETFLSSFSKFTFNSQYMLFHVCSGIDCGCDGRNESSISMETKPWAAARQEGAERRKQRRRCRSAHVASPSVTPTHRFNISAV